jgi:SUMO ligase MMS21 Smc5/6 complex component
MPHNMSAEDKEKVQFLAELGNSQVVLCRRAACSLRVAWSDLAMRDQEIMELKSKLLDANNFIELEKYN